MESTHDYELLIIIILFAATSSVERNQGKYRVVYSEAQRSSLEDEFANRKYINTIRKQELARNLGLSERQVFYWSKKILR